MAFFHLVLTCGLMFVGPIVCGLLPLMFAQMNAEGGGGADLWVRLCAFQVAAQLASTCSKLAHSSRNVPALYRRSPLQLESLSLIHI